MRNARAQKCNSHRSMIFKSVPYLKIHALSLKQLQAAVGGKARSCPGLRFREVGAQVEPQGPRPREGYLIKNKGK